MILQVFFQRIKNQDIFQRFLLVGYFQKKISGKKIQKLTTLNYELVGDKTGVIII